MSRVYLRTIRDMFGVNVRVEVYQVQFIKCIEIPKLYLVIFAVARARFGRMSKLGKENFEFSKT